MNELTFDYSIRSDLPARPESPAAIGAKFVKTLDALSRIDPTIFSNWEVMDFPAVASLPLAAARSRIASIIEKNAHRDDFRARPDWGYAACAFILDENKSRNISLRISTGVNQKGDTWLETREWNVHPIRRS
jgi:hypothetical protein